eukprot:558791-Rhodomonas_salina.1
MRSERTGSVFGGSGGGLESSGVSLRPQPREDGGGKALVASGEARREGSAALFAGKGRPQQERGEEEEDGGRGAGPVSYTHLTLPTICSV